MSYILHREGEASMLGKTFKLTPGPNGTYLGRHTPPAQAADQGEAGITPTRPS